MKSSVLFTLAGTVCCLSGLASAQVASTSAAAPAKQIGGGNEGVGFVDNCGSAATVGVGTYGFDTAGATNDFAGTCGVTGTAPDVWIKYLAASTGLANVSTCGGSGSDTVLSILSACGGPVVACLDDSCGLQTSLSFAATAGSTYVIRVAGFNGNAASGSAAISQSGGGGGGNDNCADATLVTDGTYAFDTTNATPDGAPSCGFAAGSNDVWFKYTAASAGVLTATTCDLAGHDTVLAAFAACGGAQLACNDDSCGLQSRVTVAVAAGSTTWVVVSGYNGDSGAGQVAFSFAEPCSLTRPAGAVDEAEPCQTDGGQDTNGGCNHPTGDVEAVSNNSYVWGTSSTFIDSATGGQFRDTDWYEINHAGGVLSVTGKADFDLLTFILDANCAPTILGQGGPTAGNCAESNISLDLPAGTYRIFAAKGTFDGLPCAANNNYLLTIGTPGGCPSADFNGDGFTDFFDYDDYVACFEGAGAPGCNADFNGDGFVDFFDYDAFVFAFEGCP